MEESLFIHLLHHYPKNMTLSCSSQRPIAEDFGSLEIILVSATSSHELFTIIKKPPA